MKTYDRRIRHESKDLVNVAVAVVEVRIDRRHIIPSTEEECIPYSLEDIMYC